MPSPLAPVPTRLVGLYSPSPGCGKTSAARVLQGQGFELVSFAAPLRSMVFSLLLDLGHNSGEAFALLHERKEELLPQLGVSTRHLLRTLGTEWGRSCVHPSLWLQSFQCRLAGLQQVVVDDVRFANEAQLITQLGGEIWQVRRPGHERPAEHASDGDLDGWDGFAGTLLNDGDLEQLQAQVLALLPDDAQPVAA
jgi:hypothetical protein